MDTEIEIPAFGKEGDDPSELIRELDKYMREYTRENYSNLVDGCISVGEEDAEEEEDTEEEEKEKGGEDPSGQVESDFFKREYRVLDLIEKEKEILKYAKPTDVVVEGDIKIHTAKFDSQDKVDETDNPDVGAKLPLVMVHGLGGCILAFHKNYAELSADRDVYGIDLPGFGLSSRKVKFPCTLRKFPNNQKKAFELVRKCEDRMVELIEKWRQAMELEEMILLGHSFGGYISARYSLAYPERVRHLVMVDPWGVFTEKECKDIDPASIAWKKNSVLEGLAMKLSKPWRLRPMDISRAGGNVIGVLLMKVIVPESQQEAYGDETMKYFVDVNMGKPTGEKLFSVLSGYNYVFPMTSLMTTLQKEDPKRPPITFIYGKLSRFRNPGVDLLKNLPGVSVEEVDGASHHVHAENQELFHGLMRAVFRKTDRAKKV